MKPPLSSQRFLLRFVGALLQCLDKDREPLPGAFASGFIRRENDRLFLYTCWHVVSGFDPNDVRVGFTLPDRRYLKVALQSADLRQPGVNVIGGLRTLVLPLYDELHQPSRPRWLQDHQHIPHAELNAIGLYVPFFHDLVKLELPADLKVSAIQVIDESRIFPDTTLIAPGDKCMVVGYPYGFSAMGPDQPTPVALTRFVASESVPGRRQQFLLESIGAPGISGGPVFVEREEDLLLVGVYTGSIYPDYANRSNEKVTALGTVSNVTFVLQGLLPLVSTPSQPQQPSES